MRGVTRAAIVEALRLGPASVATLCERVADVADELPSEAWVRGELGVLAEHRVVFRSTVGLWALEMRRGEP